MSWSESDLGGPRTSFRRARRPSKVQPRAISAHQRHFIAIAANGQCNEDPISRGAARHKWSDSDAFA